MDEQNVATNVEVDNSQISNTPTVDNTTTNIEVDNSQVITSATPMDSNTTYDNLANQIEPEPSVPQPNIDPNKDLAQNMVQNAKKKKKKNALQQNSGQAMDNFLNNEYDYDKNEAGTYWVAGAINDVDTQMQFLNTLVNEEMYDEMDLQKFYFDNTMATARAYAAQKQKETAYGFYRAAQEKAIAEANLTGWYMPAEGNYMLGQYTVAQNKLEDPDATPEDKAKANRVIGVTEKWFAANQISTRGIKCLSMMQYEETVRHNEIMGELQKQAQAISAAGQAASNELAWAELRFRVEEMELQAGFNYSKDIGLDNEDFIGHDTSKPEYSRWQMLDGAKTVQEVLKDPYYYSAVLQYRGTEWMKNTLGDDYETYKDSYNAYHNASIMNSADFAGVDSFEGTEVDLKNHTLPDGTKTLGKAKIVALQNEDGKMEKRVFVKLADGSWKQLDWGTVSGNNGALNHTYTESELNSLKKNHENWTKTEHVGGLDLKNGKRLGDYIKQDEFVPESKIVNGVRVYDKVYNKDGVRMYLAGNAKSGAADTSGWNGAARNQKVVDTINEYTKKGYEVKEGYYADDRGYGNNQKQGVIMYNAKEDKYISISVSGGIFSQGAVGDAHEITAKDLKSIPNKDWNDLSESQRLSAASNMEYVGTIEKSSKTKQWDGETIVYAYKDGEGNTHYVSFQSLSDSKMQIENAGSIADQMSYETWNKDELLKEGISEASLTNYENRKEEYKNNQEVKDNVSKTTKNKDTSNVLADASKETTKNKLEEESSTARKRSTSSSNSSPANNPKDTSDKFPTSPTYKYNKYTSDLLNKERPYNYEDLNKENQEETTENNINKVKEEKRNG